MLKFTTSSAEQTSDLGRRLGQAVAVPVAFMLAGSYGTGKTTFAQGLAQGLGVQGLVRSPSYSIVRTYQGTKFGFVHADLYRMKSLAEVNELGLTDMLDGGTVIAVEWPGTVDGFSLDLPYLATSFGFADENLAEYVGNVEEARVLELVFSSDCPEALAEVARAFAA